MGNTGDNSTMDGPWVGADLEAGMYYGGGPQTKVNKRNKPLPFPFVSLYLRGRTDGFVLKGGDATRGKCRRPHPLRLPSTTGDKNVAYVHAKLCV